MTVPSLPRGHAEICDRLHEIAGGSIFLPREWRKSPSIWTIWNRWPFTFTYKGGIALSLDEAADALGMSEGELVWQLHQAAKDLYRLASRTSKMKSR